MPLTKDAAVAQIAARQLGLVSRRDALDAGMTRNQIEHRIATARWEVVAPAVYRIAGMPPGWQPDALAACLARPGDARCSHLTAAALQGCCLPPPLPHITGPPTASARMPGVRVHRSLVPEEDRTMIGPIPATAIGRTLVDCAAIASVERMRSLVDAALDRDPGALDDVFAALGRMGRVVRGRQRLLGALEPWIDPIVPESPAEARLLRRLSEWGLPRPVRQHVVRDGSGTAIGRIDVAWPGHRVGLEYDGRRWHGPRRVEADEERHTALVAAGWVVLHCDRLDLRPGQDRLARLLRAALSGRPAA